MKSIPKTALILLPYLLSPANAGNSILSTGSFKTAPERVPAVNPNKVDFSFYTVMEEIGKLSMYLKVSVDAVNFVDS